MRIGEGFDGLHHDIRNRAVVWTGRYIANPLTDGLSLHEDSENGMVEVEVTPGPFSDEELRIVGIVARFGHREQTGPIVLQVDVEFVVEPPKGGAARSGSGRVSALQDEIVDDAMENNPVVETASRERCDAIRCAASAPVEKLEDHHAEIGDVNAQTAIAGQHGRRDERIARDRGKAQGLTARTPSVERDVDWGAAEKRCLRDGLKRRLRAERGSEGHRTQQKTSRLGSSVHGAVLEGTPA